MSPEHDQDTFAESRERQRQEFLESATNYHGGRRAFVAIAFTLVLFFAMWALAARQVTSASSAKSVLGTGIAQITDLDRLLAQNFRASPTTSPGPDPKAPAVPGFPIQTGLTRSDITGKSTGEVRTMLLDRAVAQVYDHGIKAFDRTGNQSVSRLSGQGLLTTLANQITGRNHSRANTALIILVILTALLAATMLLIAEPGARVRSIGLPVLLAGVAGLLASGVLWFIVGSLGSADTFGGAMRSIARAVVKVPLRDFVVLLAIGVVLLVTGPLVDLVARRLGFSVARHSSVTGEVQTEDDLLFEDEEDDPEAWEAGA